MYQNDQYSRLVEKTFVTDNATVSDLIMWLSCIPPDAKIPHDV